jgi:hypothetical protein
MNRSDPLTSFPPDSLLANNCSGVRWLRSGNGRLPQALKNLGHHRPRRMCIPRCAGYSCQYRPSLSCALAARSPRPAGFLYAAARSSISARSRSKKILQHCQTVLALSNLPGNELHNHLFLQLSFSGANLRIPQYSSANVEQTGLRRFCCSPRPYTQLRRLHRNNAQHESLTPMVGQNRHRRNSPLCRFARPLQTRFRPTD